MTDFSLKMKIFWKSSVNFVDLIHSEIYIVKIWYTLFLIKINVDQIIEDIPSWENFDNPAKRERTHHIIKLFHLCKQIWTRLRCKVVVSDGSEAHLHWHALVHFPTRKLKSWKEQARRADVKFKSAKNTFKKIKCLDHAVGVLKYITCKDGQSAGRRDQDGLHTHPQTHYSRQTIDETHQHVRGKDCGQVREDISRGIANFIDLEKTSNWNKLALQDFDTCLCDR